MNHSGITSNFKLQAYFHIQKPMTKNKHWIKGFNHDGHYDIDENLFLDYVYNSKAFFFALEKNKYTFLYLVFQHSFIMFYDFPNPLP